jgi:Flp pilus assembly protein TadD
MSQAAYQPEERERRRRQLTDQAVQMARDSRWEEAVATNRELLTVLPHDPSALNRLGKALSELGQYSEAKRAYTEALEQDPSNNIARKNLERISSLSDEEPSSGLTRASLSKRQARPDLRCWWIWPRVRSSRASRLVIRSTLCLRATFFM